MDVDVITKNKKIARNVIFVFIMSNTSNLFQNATTQIKNLLSKTDHQCVISSKPSSIDDTNDCTIETNGKKSEELFKYEPDLCEEEKFRACFIDCSCDCSVRIDLTEDKPIIFVAAVLFFSRQRRSLKVE
jgi:hypothetical protein